MSRPTSTTPGRVAVAVTREDPPRLLIASDDETLSRSIATHVVAQEDPKSFGPRELDLVRKALLEERWADAVALWMDCADTSVDVYPDEPVITPEDFTTEAATFSIRMGRVFSSQDQSS